MRDSQQLTADLGNGGKVSSLRFEQANFLFQLLSQIDHGRVHILQAQSIKFGPLRVFAAHLQLGRVVHQALFDAGNGRQLRTIDPRCHRVAQLFVSQPGHRNEKGQQQHDVLRHLGPGDGTHATQKRAQQNTAQSQQDADFELHAGQPRCDQANAINLGDHIGE